MSDVGTLETYKERTLRVVGSEASRVHGSRKKKSANIGRKVVGSLHIHRDPQDILHINIDRVVRVDHEVS